MKDLGKQPIQLELFRLTDVPYTNAFEFYEAIPRFVAGGDRAKYIRPDGTIGEVKRNDDGTALPIEKFYVHRGKGYNLTIKPASLEQKEGYKSVFPGVREEIIEFIIFKLSIERGFFFDGEDEPSAKTDNYVVFTTVYEIQQELKKRHGTKHPSYNHTQILEALQVLSETRYVLKGETKEESITFSPFVEFGYMNEKDSKSKTGKNATVYIKLNSLVAKSILAKNWRQIGYDDVIQDDSFLGRWFRKTLSLRFTQADPFKSYNIKLSTVINHSGISPYTRVMDNVRYVQNTLETLDIVAEVKVEKEYAVNPETRRRQVVDAKFIIYPSRAFTHEQVKSNAHAKRLESAVEGEGGYPLLEPRKSDFKNLRDYEKARREFLKAQT
jgi:hypothetical protein